MSTIPSNDKLGPDGCLIQDIIIQIHEYSIIIIFCLENARKEYIVCMVAISIIAIYSPSLSWLYEASTLPNSLAKEYYNFR